MPLATDSSAKSPRASRSRDRFERWNRKLHFYAGLFLLFFTWLFAFSGLLLNHPTWTFAEAVAHTSVWYHQRHAQKVPDLLALTLGQLESFTRTAQTRNLSWAKPTAP